MDGKNTYGAIRIQNGKYEDQLLVLQKGEILMIGRDINQCNLVLEAPWISKEHCSITFDETQGHYMVTDYSINGTFLEDGARLAKDQATELMPGSIVRIGEDGIGLQLL